MKRVIFELDLFQGPAQRIESEAVMRLLLEALTAANVVFLKYHPNTPSIYAGGVRYEREIPGSMPGCFPSNAIPEVWKTIPYILRDGFGDCEDLACARTAELLAQGIAAQPTFRFRVLGTMLVYHILVLLPDGRIEDPSLKLGMNRPDA
jgi:hypothetical protein